METRGNLFADLGAEVSLETRSATWVSNYQLGLRGPLGTLRTGRTEKMSVLLTFFFFFSVPLNFDSIKCRRLKIVHETKSLREPHISSNSLEVSLVP